MTTQDFNEWSTTHHPIYAKIVKLIKNLERHPFSGLGKPAPLKHLIKRLWARRITQGHRLVYNITAEEVIMVFCKFHYHK